jgi:meso-butanediol dehydrogenase / (S,S)-butanediol dehydrogenase / diacetyl reductase
MTGWRGRHAIVTGAGSGIGAAISRALLREGATVYAVDVDPPNLVGMPDEARERLRAFVVDVSDEGAVSRLVADAAGDHPVGLLFNVAGVGSTTTAPDTSVEVWNHVFDVNALGTFLMCKHVIPRMIAGGGGSIVNIASIAGLVGLPRRAAYCASKGAVIALTRALAVDHVADGVRVNCVCPGTIDTPWVKRLIEDAGESLDALRARQPMSRLGTAEEVAAAALYLAGADAGFVTGSVLAVDGGVTAA